MFQIRSASRVPMFIAHLPSILEVAQPGPELDQHIPHPLRPHKAIGTIRSPGLLWTQGCLCSISEQNFGNAVVVVHSLISISSDRDLAPMFDDTLPGPKYTHYEIWDGGIDLSE
jgi:hypothetical protein